MTEPPTGPAVTEHRTEHLTEHHTEHADLRLGIACFTRANRAWGWRYVTTWGLVLDRLAERSERADKDGPGFVPGLLGETYFKPGAYRPATADCYRCAPNARAVCLLCLDVDDGTPLAALAARLGDLEWAAYTTHSHAPGHPRFRVVVPLARPVLAAAWDGFWGGAAVALTGRDAGALAADPKARDVARFYYWPAHPPGGAPEFTHHPGSLLDPATVEPLTLPRRALGTGAAGTEGGGDGGGEPVDVSAEGPPIPEGGRNDGLYRIACALRARGAEYDEIVAHVRAVNRARCAPPLAGPAGDAELVALAASAAGFERGTGGGAGAVVIDVANSRTDAELAAEARGDGDAAGGGGGDPGGAGEAPTDRSAGLLPSAAPWTDLGNAERLAARHGGALRHATEFGWLAYARGRWDPGDDKPATRRLCETLRSAYAAHVDAGAEPGDGKTEKDNFLKFLRASEAAGKVTAALRLAATLRGLSVDAADLDRHPHLLNVANGVVDLRTGELVRHDPALLLTQQTNLALDPAAACPRWDAFLATVFQGDLDVIEFIQRAVGYSLTGDVREETLFFFSGDGANGKSTFLETVQHVLGEYACPAPPGLVMMSRSDQHPTEIAKLRGKRFVVVSETKEGVRLDEEKVKRLASSDPISARLMRQDFFEFVPTHKLWLTSNYRPLIRGTDTGIWRRLPLIKFSVTFRKPGEALPGEPVRDDGLKDYLRNHESAGILAWAVRGAVAWHQGGLRPPPAVLEASREYREDMDWLGQFLAECCREEEGQWSASTAVYQAYREWCTRHGEQPRTHIAFGEFLGKSRLPKRRTKRGVEWGLTVRSMGEILGESYPHTR